MKRLALLIGIVLQCFAALAGNYLFFDTETVGLPVDYDSPASDTANWPRMVQLSWILTDGQGNRLSQGDYIIRPNGFVVPETASNIHGITTERAYAEGAPLDSVLVLFMRDLDSAEYIVGHNVSFDIHVVDAEMIRSSYEGRLSSMKAYCTMIASIDYCKLPGMYGHYKWPKLQELHKVLFGCNFDGAHNSAADIDATCKCFWELRRRGII